MSSLRGMLALLPPAVKVQISNPEITVLPKQTVSRLQNCQSRDCNSSWVAFLSPEIASLDNKTICGVPLNSGRMSDGKHRGWEQASLSALVYSYHSSQWLQGLQSRTDLCIAIQVWRLLAIQRLSVQMLWQSQDCHTKLNSSNTREEVETRTCLSAFTHLHQGNQPTFSVFIYLKGWCPLEKSNQFRKQSCFYTNVMPIFLGYIQPRLSEGDGCLEIL